MISNLLSNDHNTIALYFGIVFISTLLAYFSQRSITGAINIIRAKSIPYFLSFVNTAFFATFSGVGRDRINYIYMFNNISFERIFHGSEPGFELIQFLISLVTNNPEVFISIISLWTVINIYKGLWKYQDIISLGMAIFLFTSQYYFQSFSLIRIYFATSFLIRYAYLLREEKYIKYGIVILMALSIHYSIVFALIAYILAFVFMRSRQYSGVKFYALIIGAIIISLFGTGLFGFLLNFTGNAIISKYSLFLSNVSSTQLGFKWILNIIPYLLVYPFRTTFGDEGKKEVSLSTGYFIVALMISILSYSVPVIGRGLIVLNMPVLIILPMGFQMYRISSMQCNAADLTIGFKRIRVKISFRTIKALCIVWGIVSMILYLSEYMPVDGIDNFKFVWS